MGLNLLQNPSFSGLPPWYFVPGGDQGTYSLEQGGIRLNANPDQYSSFTYTVNQDFPAVNAPFRFKGNLKTIKYPTCYNAHPYNQFAIFSPEAGSLALEFGVYNIPSVAPGPVAWFAYKGDLATSLRIGAPSDDLAFQLDVYPDHCDCFVNGQKVGTFGAEVNFHFPESERYNSLLHVMHKPYSTVWTWRK